MHISFRDVGRADRQNENRNDTALLRALMLCVLYLSESVQHAWFTVTVCQCNTLVARCSRQLIGPADWVFVTLGPLCCD